jgi:hypothetical protein
MNFTGSGENVEKIPVSTVDVDKIVEANVGRAGYPGLLPFLPEEAGQ